MRDERRTRDENINSIFFFFFLNSQRNEGGSALYTSHAVLVERDCTLARWMTGALRAWAAGRDCALFFVGCFGFCFPFACFLLRFFGGGFL